MVGEIAIKQKLEDLKSGKLSCQENIEHFLNEIKSHNKELNIFLEINGNAINRAKELDTKKKSENSGKLGKLFGLAVALKSNISTTDFKMSCASKTLENYKATFNADVVEKLLDEDAIIIGIVNNDEFACGSSGETSAFDKTINPHSKKRIPGGSSSGSAAAVSAKLCDIAFGTDTGGSIRNPASHCSVVGVKPSYGRVSRYGLIDLSMSLDQIGPLTSDVYTSALAMSVISGNSDKDPTTINKEVFEYEKELETNKKFKIGIIKTFNSFIQDDRIKDIFDKNKNKLKELGHEIVEIDIKNIDLAIQAYYPIVYTEFFSGTRKFDSIKYGEKIEDTAGEEVLRRILGGKEISKSEFDGAYYKKALKVKDIIAKEFDRVFKEVDLILTPVTPILPHTFGKKLSPEEMYAYDAFTIPANLGGICAGVVSIDEVEEQGEKISVGMQFYAEKFNEKTLLQGMKILEDLKI